MGYRYEITSTIEFSYESEHGEFSNLAEAEKFAGNYDNLVYQGPYDLEIKEIETCDECCEDLDNCECEEEE